MSDNSVLSRALSALIAYLAFEGLKSLTKPPVIVIEAKPAQSGNQGNP